MSSDSNAKRVEDVDIHACEFNMNITYDQFSDEETVRSPQFYASNNDSIKWSLIFKPLYNETSGSGYLNNASVQLRAMHEIEKSGVYGGEVMFCLSSNFPNQEITFKGTFVLSEFRDLSTKNKKWRSNSFDGRLVYTYILSEEGQCLLELEGTLSLKCKITFFKLNNVIPLFISHRVSASNLLEDFGKSFLSEEHSDVTLNIKIKGKELKTYPAHKVILSARSSVFEAMFKHDMKENKLSCVDVEDVNEEVFLEMLRYIYTGQAQNLDTLAYELLSVADRYDLDKLKITCAKVLSRNLSEETALRIVTLADMHHVDDLSGRAIQFIKSHSDVIKNMDSKAWDDLMSRPNLVKKLLLASIT